MRRTTETSRTPRARVLALALALAVASALAAAATLAPVPARAQDLGAPVGQFHGLRPVQDSLSARLLPPGAVTYRMGHYLGSSALGELLGAYQGRGTVAAFRNGAPNGTNTLLWQVLAFGLAQDLASVCREDRHGPAKRLSEEARADLLAACENPRQLAALERLWLRVMGYQAPFDEFLLWAAFFQRELPADLEPSLAVAELTRAILLHPHFLLRH